MSNLPISFQPFFWRRQAGSAYDVMSIGAIQILRNRFTGSLTSTTGCFQSGAYLGGAWCHDPPLGRQDSIIRKELHAKVRYGPPLCNLGRKFEHTNGQNLGEDFNFEPKAVLNLSEDLFFVFFFGLHLILGRKTDCFRVEKFFFWSSQFSNFLPPLSKILRTLLVPVKSVYNIYRGVIF